MDENRGRTAVPLDHGRRPIGPSTGKRQRAATGIDERPSLWKPVTDLQRRVADRPGQLPPEGPGSGLAKLQHQIGDPCTLPRTEEEACQQHARDDDHRNLVGEQRRQAGLLGRDHEVNDRARGEHETQPGRGLQRNQAHPAGRANHPRVFVAAHTEQQRGEQDRGGFALPDRRDDRRGVEDGDRRAGNPRRPPATRIREQKLEQRPAVQVESMSSRPRHDAHADSGEVPEEPGEARGRHQDTRAALRAPDRRDEPAADQAPADSQIRDPVAGITPAVSAPLRGQADRGGYRQDQEPALHRTPKPIRAASAFPDNSLFEMNPRADA